MAFFKNLIGRVTGGSKKEPEQMRGMPELQSDDERSASRNRMEAEMAESKERRNAPAPAEEAAEAPKDNPN